MYTYVLQRMVRGLNPASFAMVMATGIVSVAMDVQGWGVPSAILLWIGVLAYVVLVLAYLVRFVRYPGAVAVDLRIPTRTFGFFTFVAATGVLGDRLLIDGHVGVAEVALGITALSWLILGYVLPATAFGARGDEAPLRRADGSWFVWVVATQAVAVLASSLQPKLPGLDSELALLAVSCWAIGVFLYVAVAVFVAARLLLARPAAADVSGAYWVAMGATAISVVAGSHVETMTAVPLTEIVGSTVAAGTFLLWAFGTWLVPALLVAGYWRHVVHRVPLRYEVSLWTIIFPLGMYGVASRTLGTAHDLSIVNGIGHAEIWLACIAWAATFCAMVWTQGRLLLQRSES
ncbi:tellurite resistance/C4-dicarboxylate transporter family protein [Gordonia sp. HY442]|uniref:tellurite resistance/C4-dicarboxylate transporter family protein n=1 Tax=Gordonia zhenghanii TaxID=2911516 RepID=UPI001F18D217|nr:tellurite resistance/C4-dicarboxylate transporter family protein [Gordonia zhenghanii]MCF8604988.1 tellurite resistance/C4-dicarboxylate transporter family protein [Gordonia zhenghanii]